MTSATLRALGVAAAALLALSACTANDAGEPADVKDEFVLPSGTASPSLAPITEQPRDTRKVQLESFHLYVPAEYQQSDRQGPEDITMTVLGKPADEPGGVIELVAFEQADPGSGAQEQMAVLAAKKAELEGVTDLRRESIEWPGASLGVIVQWSENTTTSAGSMRQRFAQLVLQLENGLVMTVIAVAPEDEFEPSGVLDVLRTLTVDPSL